MGYEDVRVKGEIRDADRCGLCGLLCSIDLFIETKCYHLFCAECFEVYLKRNGHSGDIRDEGNYTRPYNPVRCPVSAKILQHKHSRGALYLKMKQYFRLSQYRITCEFGCYTKVKANRLADHYLQCFFTSRRLRDELDRDHLLFQPDYTNNNLYEDVRLRTEPVDRSVFERNASWLGSGPTYGLDGVPRNNSGGDPFGSFNLKKTIDFGSGKNSALHNLIDLRSESAYESIDERPLLGSEERGSPVDHFRRPPASLVSASSIELAGESAKNEQTLFDCLMAERLDSSTASPPKTDDFDDLKRQLDLIQKNVNFIKKQLLPSYED